MQEEKQVGKIIDMVVLRRLFQYIKPYRLKFYLLVGVILLSAFLSPLLPLLIQYAIDKPVSQGDYSGLSIALLLMIGLLAANSILSFFNTYLAGWLGQNIIKDIRIELYYKIIHLRIKFFDDTPIGRLVTRTISDIETLSEVFSSGFAAIAGDFLQLILIISVMFYTDWRLSLISLSSIPFMLISTYVFKEKVKKSFGVVRAAVSNLNTFVQEHITGMAIVQIFNAEDREYGKFLKINEEHRDANIKSILYYSIYYPVAEVIAALGTGLVVWYGAKEIINEQASYGTITAFIMFINQFFRPIRMIADRINTLQMGVVSTERIFDLLDTKEYNVVDGHISKEINGKISFKNVWFAYNDEKYVLKDINFEVNSGETVAFVGATGAGKSSLINLISRFYEINKGSIEIDDINNKEYLLSNLRSQIGVVLQDVFLFSDSIHANITMNDNTISREKVIEASKLVGIHDFIMSLPQNYDYNVMERGATLSVGQRQLISFVRVLVQNPKIIILDEATSSVDSESEELIQNAIKKLLRGRTSIVIAHRLSTIQNANCIHVIDNGQIVESGSHENLLLQNGYYAKLKSKQLLLV